MKIAALKKPQHNLASLNLRSSSSSSTGGRAEGISWISRRVCSVDWRVPSWCSCWLTQEGVKPPSSWDRLEGVGEDTAMNKGHKWKQGPNALPESHNQTQAHFLGPPVEVVLRLPSSCSACRCLPCWRATPSSLGNNIYYQQQQQHHDDDDETVEEDPGLQSKMFLHLFLGQQKVLQE